MHKISRLAVAVGVTALTATALTGCSGSSSPGSTAGSGKAAKDISITFVAGITSDPFFRAMQLGANAEAKKLGIKLTWTGSPSEYSPQSQIPFVDNALANGIDGLVLVPTDPDSLQPSVTKAQALKIPVVTVDTTVTDTSSLLSRITGDNVQGGAAAADTLAKQIGGSGEVYIQSGSPTGTTNTLREKGFRAELTKAYPNIKIVGKQYSLSQPAKATSDINSAILANPDLKGIFAIDGTSVTGAVAALKNSKKVGDIKLVGYDAYSTEVDALKQGVITALIAQDPAKEARLALDDMVDKITGKDVSKIEKSVVIPNVVMTKDNLAQTGKYQYAS